MTETDFLIVGGGIAGTSCANWLAENHSVRLLEMEGQPGYHTTGRSVAVYTEAYGPRTIRALAKSSHAFLTNPPAGFSETPLSRPHGLLFVGRDDQRQSLDVLLAVVQELSPKIHEVSVKEALGLVPVLREHYLGCAFLDPTTLALDVNAIHQGYIRGLKAKGGEVVCDAQALTFERKAGKWHVHTSNGDFSAAVVFNAAGAWADVVAERIGADLVGLQPKQRTVIAFTPTDVNLSEDWPVLLDVDEEFIAKIDAGTVLASPADETPVPAQDAQPDELDIAITVDRLERITTMKVGRIQRTWAGLRSFVPDGVPVVGYDPKVEGFFWCAGQGGYGIETSNGLGRASAALAVGCGLPDDIKAFGVTEADLSAARFATV